MKRAVLGLICFFAFAVYAQAQALDTCTITGTLYDAQGQLAPGSVLTIQRVYKSRLLMRLSPQKVRADGSAHIVFTLPRGKIVNEVSDVVAFLEADMSGFNTPGGKPIAVPDSSTATLETLPLAQNIPKDVLPIRRTRRRLEPID